MRAFAELELRYGLTGRARLVSRLSFRLPAPAEFARHGSLAGRASALLSRPPRVPPMQPGSQSFTDYGVSRDALPQTCISCIDRGFIMMMDLLLQFLKDSLKEFHILHLDSED